MKFRRQPLIAETTKDNKILTSRSWNVPTCFYQEFQAFTFNVTNQAPFLPNEKYKFFFQFDGFLLIFCSHMYIRWASVWKFGKWFSVRCIGSTQSFDVHCWSRYILNFIFLNLIFALTNRPLILVSNSIFIPVFWYSCSNVRCTGLCKFVHFHLLVLLYIEFCIWIERCASYGIRERS